MSQRLEGVVAEGQMPAVSLDQPERHVDHRNRARRGLKLRGARELHLHGR